MSTPLRFWSLLLSGLLLGWAPQVARASHAIGGDLTYAPLGNNQYRVHAKFFRDCSGIAAPNSMTLLCNNSGSCAGSATLTATMPQIGQPVVGAPWCPQVQAQAVCPLNGQAPAGAPDNYAVFDYEATVTLPPGQWVLSVEESARPSTANLSSNTQATLRLEARLDNRTGLQNTSPVFSNYPVFFVYWQRLNQLHMNAFDADGDSLAFSLDQPLAGCGTPETYANYPSACTPTAAGNCLYSCSPAFSSTYTAQLPLLVANDTVGTCPNKTVQPRFHFDGRTGDLTFEPSAYVPASASNPSSAGRNKYVAVVKVSEYRRVSGQWVNIGSVRRDLMFVVYDCGPNQVPRVAPTVQVQSGLNAPRAQAFGQTIWVHSGEPIDVTLTSTDPDAGQTLAWNLSQNPVPGAQLRALGNGSARLTFTPPLNLPLGTYRVSVTTEDDACPLKAAVTQALTFRVYSGTLAARTAQSAIAAYPTPFTSQVQFQLSKAGVQTVSICDRLGRAVTTLRSQPDGLVRWTPGAEVPAGLYLARTADGTQTVRLLRSGE